MASGTVLVHVCCSTKYIQTVLVKSSRVITIQCLEREIKLEIQWNTTQ